jgi:caffeoyl-CoA O-methyltransferase
MRRLAIAVVGSVVLALLADVVTAQPPAEGEGPPGGRPGRPGARGLREPGRGMRFGRGGFGAPAAQAPPLGKTDEEKKTLAVLDEMDRNERRGMMNVPVWDGRMLRLLTEAVDAKHVVEIGSSNGYSGIWIALALRTTGGRLTTHDIDPGRAALARKNFKRAGVDSIVTLVEGDAHQEVTKLKGPIDVVFIDADKEGYPDYLEKLLPLVRPGGLILAHNTDMRQGGIGEYVKAVTTDPDLETLFLPGSSLSVTLKKR